MNLLFPGLGTGSPYSIMGEIECAKSTRGWVCVRVEGGPLPNSSISHLRRAGLDTSTSNLDELLTVSAHFFGFLFSIIECGLPVALIVPYRENVCHRSWLHSARCVHSRPRVKLFSIRTSRPWNIVYVALLDIQFFFTTETWLYYPFVGGVTQYRNKNFLRAVRTLVERSGWRKTGPTRACKVPGFKKGNYQK